MHDYNGGIQPNGLFWTVRVPPRDFSFTANGTRARLDVRNVPITDSFFFGGPNVVPATVDIHVRWTATAPAVPLGRGAAVPPTDSASFLGDIAPARAVGSFAGRGMGFAFRSREGASSDQGYAELGRERNGAFL